MAEKIERNFTLCRGGLDELLKTGERQFKDAYVTDTRLMGVIGMCVHWEISGEVKPLDLRQFFYMDAEEFGFENYQRLTGDNENDFMLLESSLFGGLGGKRIPITEKEACALLQHYAALNEKFSLPLPTPVEEYEAMLKADIKMTPEEEEALFKKQCPKLCSPYHAINYFLMRCFAKDFEAADRMSGNSFELELFPELPAATLSKNTIDTIRKDGNTYFMSQSILQFEDEYRLALTEITVSEDFEITGYRRRFHKKISDSEAAMSLSNHEYVTLFDINDVPGATELIWGFLSGITNAPVTSSYENGDLFLVYKRSNDHVQQRIYRLNEDVLGLFFLSDYGQLLLSSYALDGLEEMENLLHASPFAQFLLPVGKYEFLEPVVYEFIQSDFSDFEEFLEVIRDDGDDDDF